jgi:Beta-lactamase enzyme family
MPRSPLCACLIPAMLAIAIVPLGIAAGTQAFTVVDDPWLDRIVREVRSDFLDIVDYDRVDVCLLIPNPEDETTWWRGSFGGDNLTYPASCVKLVFLAAAMQWSRENGLPYDHLDEHLHPMIVESSNVATGHVVDALSGAPNLAEAVEGSEAYEAWLEARRYPARFLDERGLLGDQIIVHKTFPSNSGDSPTGAEALARETEGMNRMSPNLIAELMLEVARAAIEPEANDYMRELLRRDRWSDHSYFGSGLPPGTINESKPGLAYDTREDVARILLPNGQEFILAVFTDGRRGNSSLGTFASMLIDRLDLRRECPARIRVTTEDADFSLTGHWSPGELRRDRFGRSYLYHAGVGPEAQAVWDLEVPESGFYEITAWFPQAPELATDAPFVVEHAGGISEPIRVDQQERGGQWVLLGDFYLTRGGGRVILSNDIADPNQLVIADTVQATLWPPMSPEPGTDVVVDNDHVAPHYVETGEWGMSPWLGHDGRTYAYGHTGTDAIATFIAPLTEPGLYEITTHFRAGPNRATEAVFEIETADGEQIATIDQTGQDMVWRTLGTFRFEAGDAVVRLRADRSTGGPVVISDALRFCLVE